MISLLAALLVGCATTRYAEDAGDPCAAERAELRGAQHYYAQSILTGAAIGAAAGGALGAIGKLLSSSHASSKDVAKGALIGAAGGATIGAIGGYYQAKQQNAADAAALSNSILKDVQTENSEIERATLAFAKLRNCRFTLAQQVKSDFAAGRISRAQAISRLDELRARFNQDLAIADEVGTKMADRGREFKYASDQLVAANPEAQTYLKTYPMTSEEPITAPSTSKPAPKPTPRVTASRAAGPKPPPKAAPAVTVAQETNANQLKQKKFSNEIAVAKSESGKALSLEGQFGLILPACPVCSNS